MTAAHRDRLLLLILPSAAVALAWWGLLRPTAQLREALQHENTAHAAVPSAGALSTQRSQTDKVKSEEAQLAQQQKAWLSQWEQMRRGRSDSLGRPAALARVADILRRHDLTLIREEPPSTGKGSTGGQALFWVVGRMRRPTMELMPELAAVRKAESKAAMPGAPAAPSPPIAWGSKNGAFSGDRTMTDVAAARSTWKLEFAGNFQNVRAALSELAETETAAIPVQLLMAKAKPNLTLRRWTLVIAL